MLRIGGLDENSDTPLYRQLYTQIRRQIDSGEIARGYRLPPTRELAAKLKLNRTTVSAAYDLLEGEGLITGHVGRGSYVSGPGRTQSGMNWRQLLPPSGESALALTGS